MLCLSEISAFIIYLKFKLTKLRFCLGRSLVDVPIKWPQMKTTETNRKFIETDWNELYQPENSVRPMATLLKKNSKLT